MKKYDFTNLEENLIKKGYAVKVFESKDLAVDYLKKEITSKAVGFGGSATLKELNLYDALSKNNTVIWHDKMPSGLTVMEVRTKASRADVYVSSVNGISENGDIINIDYTGNRVSAISFGPKKVYLIIGSNKVAPTFELALDRARNIAGPLNAKRLNRKTPCAVNGDRCYDCNSPDRICRSLSVLWQKPMGADYEIILIDEKLGY